MAAVQPAYRNLKSGAGPANWALKVVRAGLPPLILAPSLGRNESPGSGVAGDGPPLGNRDPLGAGRQKL